MHGTQPLQHLPDPLIPLSYPIGKAWHVVYCNIRCEFRASMGLQAKGFEVFLPTTERWVAHARKKTKVIRALFTRYLFVSFDPDLEEWFHPIKTTDGVEDLLRNNLIPLRISNDVIRDLQGAHVAGFFDETSEILRLKEGSKVKPIAGPFADIVGKLKNADDRERVEVLMSILGAERVVRFSVRDLRPA